MGIRCSYIGQGVPDGVAACFGGVQR
jgi:hypothetical protein